MAIQNWTAKRWCEAFSGHGDDFRHLLQIQQCCWIYVAYVALLAAWNWQQRWGSAFANTGEMAAVAGGIKTFGFALVDVLAVKSLQDACSAQRKVVCRASDSTAMCLLSIGISLAAVQLLYWMLFLVSLDWKSGWMHAIRTAVAAVCIVVGTPGLICAFLPAMTGLEILQIRLQDLRALVKKDEEKKVDWEQFLICYGQLDVEATKLMKELNPSIRWLLTSALLYFLLQCFSVWLWIDKVALAPKSVYVTYALAVLYGGLFATGYGLFRSVDKLHGQLVKDIAESLGYLQREDALKQVQVYAYVVSRPISWSPPLLSFKLPSPMDQIKAGLPVAIIAGKVGLQMMRALFHLRELAEDPKMLEKTFSPLKPDTVFADPEHRKASKPKGIKADVPLAISSLPQEGLKILQASARDVSAIVKDLLQPTNPTKQADQQSSITSIFIGPDTELPVAHTSNTAFASSAHVGQTSVRNSFTQLTQLKQSYSYPVKSLKLSEPALTTAVAVLASSYFALRLLLHRNRPTRKSLIPSIENAVTNAAS